eukprot:9484519-Pyramimonas_sp.AAC.1
MEKEMAKEIGSEKLHKLYTDKITFAGNQKPLSASFVDSAVTVYKRVLSLSQARRHLEWAEENMLDNYPFKTIGSLQALVDRGQTASRISWAIWGMTDLYRMDAGTLTENAMHVLRPSGMWVGRGGVGENNTLPQCDPT